MAPPNTAAFTRSRDGSGGHAQFHHGHSQQHHHQHADGCGDNQYQNLWRDTVQRDRQQRDPIGQPSGNYDLHGDRRNEGLFVQRGDAARRHHRDARHHAHHLHYLYHAVAICLLAIAPATAEEPTTVVAAPQSSSTGSVTNQAVQINQGSYNNQSFGSGLTCLARHWYSRRLLLVLAPITKPKATPTTAFRCRFQCRLTVKLSAYARHTQSKS
jgi:hypothetical protein